MFSKYSSHSETVAYPTIRIFASRPKGLTAKETVMRWTEIPAGDLHAAEQRMRVALGENASAVVERINNDPLFLGRIAGFATACLSKNLFFKERRKLVVWKTITGGANKKDSRYRYFDGRIYQQATLLIKSGNSGFGFSTKPYKADLVLLSLGELGISLSESRVNHIFEPSFLANWSREYLDGQEIGLCQAEDGVRLFEQYADQNPRERVLIGMRPLLDITGSFIFLVEQLATRDIEDQRLGVSHFDGLYHPDDLMVFRLKT